MAAQLALAAAQVGFSILQGAGEASQQRQQAQMHQLNTETARRQARIEAQRVRSRNRRRLGSIRAGFGASGVQMVGTPLAVMADQAMEARIQEVMTRTQMRGRALESEIAASRSQGRARESMISGFTRAIPPAVRGIERGTSLLESRQ